jgi:hypothetical protein
MKNRTIYTDETLRRIKQLYLAGNSSIEVISIMDLSITPRTLQRYIKDMKISRSIGEAYRLAMSKGRVKWHQKEVKKHRSKLNPTLRYKILKRDNFTCVLCGRSSPRCILEVDHIDGVPDNNQESNLQTLCYDCNIGKYTNKD